MEKTANTGTGNYKRVMMEREAYKNISKVTSELWRCFQEEGEGLKRNEIESKYQTPIRKESSMLRKFVTGRLHSFIDVANIFYSQTLGWRVSYEKLKRCLSEECDLHWTFPTSTPVFPRPNPNTSIQGLSRIDGSRRNE